MKNLISICLFVLSTQAVFAQQTNSSDTPAALPATEKKACTAEPATASGATANDTPKMIKKTAAVTSTFQTAQFQVWGNCGMCKKTIETAAKGVAGVQSADWNVDTHQFTVSFDPAQAAVEKIHQAIAAAGYDTDALRGDDKAYEKLHTCCHYERKN